MQIDIMECRGKVYSYYTFVKGQNVMGYDNRTGSYFALTIRMDAYYADLQNMYKILSAAYEKCASGVSFKNKEKASSSLFKTSP